MACRLVEIYVQKIGKLTVHYILCLAACNMLCVIFSRTGQVVDHYPNKPKIGNSGWKFQFSSDVTTP